MNAGTVERFFDAALAASEKNNKKRLLTAGAFELYREDVHIPLADVRSAFPGFPQARSSVSTAEYREFRKEWERTHRKAGGLLFTANAFALWKERGGEALMSRVDIVAATGKERNIDARELRGILDTEEKRTQFHFDGVPVPCSRCNREFQPVSRVVFDRNGRAVHARGGSPVRSGNFMGEFQKGEFVAVAVCTRCSRHGGGRLYPRDAVEAFVERKNRNFLSERGNGRNILKLDTGRKATPRKREGAETFRKKRSRSA